PNMINHAHGLAFVRSAWTENDEIPKPDDDPTGQLGSRSSGYVVHDHFGKRVCICRCGAVCFDARFSSPTVSRRRGSVDDSCLCWAREIQKSSETLHVIVHLNELVVQSRVGDRREMKNCIEFLVAELFSPIKRR